MNFADAQDAEMSLFDLSVGVQAEPAPRKTAKKPMSDRLIAKLENDGVLDTSKPGMAATRRTRMTFCAGCRQHVMRGLLSPPAAWAVDADPQPLSAEGEALALLSGRCTYDLHWRYDHYELEFRGGWQWHHRDGDEKSERDILAEHRCGEPARWPPAPSRLPPPRRAVVDVQLPDEPPF